MWTVADAALVVLDGGLLAVPDRAIRLLAREPRGASGGFARDSDSPIKSITRRAVETDATSPNNED
jgi:hypothetical protein